MELVDKRLSEKIDSVDKGLYEKIDSVDKRLSGKIDSVKQDVIILRQDVNSLRHDFIRHLESHNASDKTEQ